MAELTQLQHDILQEKKENPDDSPKEIAARLDCSESHAYQTLQDYDTAHIDKAEIKASESSNDSAESSDSELGKWILIALVVALVWAIQQGVI